MTDITPDLVNPHGQGPQCGDLHCSFHHVDEPGDGAYRICVECGHVYQKASDLQAAFMVEVAPSLSTPPAGAPSADEIWFCPLCAHDF